MWKPVISRCLVLLILSTPILAPSISPADEVVRPEEIVSLRQVVYDTDTYVRLAELWMKYNKEYPSEYAYANWMYAARYAGNKDYEKLLDAGVAKYPANPTLLYLKSISCQGKADNEVGRELLERAVRLDPDYTDPWFSLVTYYMESGEEENTELALRKLLESGAITDDVMDYNFNVITCLDEDAILITNGDNDTYPSWVLTRILGVRPDVTIANRSLLNTTWYPSYLMKGGFPLFIHERELEELRNTMSEEFKKSGSAPPTGGLFGDTLITMIVKSAKLAGRPVYIAETCYDTPTLDELREQGRNLGLATLVTPSDISYEAQLRQTYADWISSFRTGGLDSWRLRNSKAADAGRMLVTNYAGGIMANLKQLQEQAPELRTDLFEWYIDHVDPVLSDNLRHKFAYGWCCYAGDMSEIDRWCKNQGLECEEK